MIPMLKLAAMFLLPIFHLLYTRRGLSATSDYEVVHKKNLEIFKVKKKTRKHSPEPMIGINRKSRLHFKLRREKTIDRFLKKIGLGQEIDTGDWDFDERIYIESDNIFFQMILHKNADLRAVITGLFEAGADTIESNGNTLIVEMQRHVEPTEAVEKLFLELHEELTKSKAFDEARASSSFLLSTLFAEFLIYGLFTYVFFSIQEFFFDYDRTLVPLEMVKVAAMLCLGSNLLILSYIYFALGTSARAPRLFMLAILMGLVGSPGWYFLTADANKYFDRSKGVTIDAHLDRKFTYSRETSRSRVEHTLELSSGENNHGYFLPRYLIVNESTYDELTEGPITITIGRGGFNLPYYRSFEIREP